MKKLLFLGFFIVQIFFIEKKLASTYTGKIESLSIREIDGLVFIYLNGIRTSDIPNCAKSQPYMIIKNENSANGKRQLALLMMAQATNKTVVVVGADTCSRWIDGEDINIINVLKK